MSFEDGIDVIDDIIDVIDVICFPVTLRFLASMSLFCLYCFLMNKKTPEISLRPPSDIFRTKACSKLALQSTSYCPAFTQSS